MSTHTYTHTKHITGIHTHAYTTPGTPSPPTNSQTHTSYSFPSTHTHTHTQKKKNPHKASPPPPAQHSNTNTNACSPTPTDSSVHAHTLYFHTHTYTTMASPPTHTHNHCFPLLHPSPLPTPPPNTESKKDSQVTSMVEAVALSWSDDSWSVSCCQHQTSSEVCRALMRRMRWVIWMLSSSRDMAMANSWPATTTSVCITSSTLPGSNVWSRTSAKSPVYLQACQEER